MHQDTAGEVQAWKRARDTEGAQGRPGSNLPAEAGVGSFLDRWCVGVVMKTRQIKVKMGKAC